VISLSLRGVTKKFGRVLAVDQANLDVHSGEFLVVVGESGCGKTTTLRLIAGLESPDSGTIFIGGVPVNDVPVGKRNVQMIFQNFALWPHMKVFDESRYSNLSLPLKVRKWSHDKIGEMLRPLARRVGIEDSFFRRKPMAAAAGCSRTGYGDGAADSSHGRTVEQYRSSQPPENAQRDLEISSGKQADNGLCDA
jgi:multiple sugar transport system ATP-binding protein